MHPLTLPLLLADAERDRHAKLIGEFHSMLMQRACEFSNESRRVTEASETQSSYSSTTITDEKSSEGLLRPERDSESMSQWMELYHLRNGLENWKAQLRKLAEHQQGELHCDYPSSFWSPNNKTEGKEDLSRCLYRQNKQVQARLQQLLMEYDEKIRVSSLVIEGMNFATQVVSVFAVL